MATGSAGIPRPARSACGAGTAAFAVRRALSAWRSCRGFTYLGLLIAIVVMAIGLSAVGTVARTLQLRDKERELLFAGDQFRRAIASYYEKTPGPIKQFPRSLDDLLKDNRYPDVQRHLRRIYVEPITGKQEWGLVEIPGRGIAGVYSLSAEHPVRIANFPAAYKNFAAATRYSEWKFVYAPASTAAPVPRPPSAPAP